jgi:hypothetical protein
MQIEKRKRIYPVFNSCFVHFSCAIFFSTGHSPRDFSVSFIWVTNSKTTALPIVYYVIVYLYFLCFTPLKLFLWRLFPILCFSILIHLMKV